MKEYRTMNFRLRQELMATVMLRIRVLVDHVSVAKCRLLKAMFDRWCLVRASPIINPSLRVDCDRYQHDEYRMYLLPTLFELVASGPYTDCFRA